MPAQRRDEGTDPICPMCWRPVVRGSPAFFEQGDVIHPGCHLGLMDAGAAIACLLRERPGQPLCVDCIAKALSITALEAEGASERLRPLRGFEIRRDVCVGCSSRRQVVRALRAVGRPPGAGRTRREGAG
jgi:hypothetical protein